MITQSREFHISVLPSTPTGRWALLLLAVSLVVLGVFSLISRPDADAVTRSLMLGSILVTAFAGIGGLILALAAILRSHERGLLLALPILWGLAVAALTLGELAFPH